MIHQSFLLLILQVFNFPMFSLLNSLFAKVAPRILCYMIFYPFMFGFHLHISNMQILFYSESEGRAASLIISCQISKNDIKFPSNITVKLIFDNVRMFIYCSFCIFRLNLHCSMCVCT